MSLVVVIDDEVEIGEILAYILKKEGFETKVYNDPLEAQRSLENLNPHFIICDFKMPGLNGLELFLNIKDQVSCPFVILTGEPATDPEELKASGIKDVLFKPRDLIKVAQVVKEHLLKSNA